MRVEFVKSERFAWWSQGGVGEVQADRQNDNQRHKLTSKFVSQWSFLIFDLEVAGTSGRSMMPDVE